MPAGLALNCCPPLGGPAPAPELVGLQLCEGSEQLCLPGAT